VGSESEAVRETGKCKIHPEEMLRRLIKLENPFPSPVMRLTESSNSISQDYTVKYKSIITKLTFLPLLN